MTINQILLWLLGPGVASGVSYLLDQNVNWRNWSPAPLFGFSPKAILVSIGSGLIGLGTYALATSRPDLIDTADPLVKTWFPLLSPIAVQLWHAFINKRLNATTVTATTESGTVSATAKSDDSVTSETKQVG